ncbi:MAG TPA: SGNH/GDSL hydrolase family protein, partial [Mucilaginibacter sp.]|nr:SGNH/GDSL hydrolase family protein [Mucilaginibacter sp.]
MRYKYTLTTVIFCAILVVRSAAQSIAPFKNGDRVVFVGNSITDGGHYHSYIWLYYMTRFPDMQLRMFNAGIGGDVARQIDERMQDDVFSRNPTVMTLTFGMNDTGYQFLTGTKADSVYAQKLGVSYASFQQILKKLATHPQVRKILIGSSPYDETSKIKARPMVGKNAAIQKVEAFMQDAAKKNDWDFVDFNRPMLAINAQQQQRDSLFTLQGSDRIHPGNDGYMVMAYIFLKAQGLAGKKVAMVDINAKSRTIHTENCTVSNLKAAPGNVEFSYVARSLPYPLDTIPQGGGKQLRSQADALSLVPFTKEFNQETFKLSGLPADREFELRIDSNFIGKWSGAQLDSGINLALYHSTPQYQQALAVMHLNEERWQIERRLREYYWLQYSILKPKGLLYNDSESTVDSLQNYAKKDFFVAVTLPTYRNARFKSVREAWQKEIELLRTEIYRINRPRIHHFTVRPV